ncbi:MAG: CPBP family glutamic-type intramembrane protease, partial [Thermoanaerobaculia bacterium]
MQASTRRHASPRPRAVLALLLLVPAPSIGVLAAMWAARGPVGQAVYGLSKLWILALPLLWLKLVERAPLSLSPPRRGGMALGIASGCFMGGAIALAYLLLGSGWIDAAAVRRAAELNGIGTPGRYVGLALYLTFINSLLEEYVWRWFVFRRAEELMPGPAAAPASGLFFTFHHTIALSLQLAWPATLLSSAGIFAGATTWSW